MTGRALVRLRRGELDEAKRALRGAGLPTDDVNEDVTAVYRLADGHEAVGWAALERHGDEALLRSVIVIDQRRRGGVGTELVGKVLKAAADDGVCRVWLLTETAAPFFSGLGFERARRQDAPDAIRRTSEFSGICPSSAVCMSLGLARR